MPDVDVFRNEFLPNVEAATVTFAGWKKRYPAEFAAWVVYRDAVLAGEWFPELPTMSSKFAKALVAAAQMAERYDMNVNLSTDQGTSDLEGTVTVTASVQPSQQATLPVNCKFLVDGVQQATDTSYPLTFAWDTTVVADGNHILKAVVTAGTKTRSAQGAMTVSVLNNVVLPPPPPPPPPPAPPVNTALPAISGTATEGQTLSVSNGTWTNSPDSYTRQWVRCDAAGANCLSIPSATGVSYTLTAADVDTTIRCWVTAFNNAGPSAPAQTAQTAVIGALTPAVPSNTVLPEIAGTASQGFSLSVSNGAWTNSPTSYTRQWRRCDSAGAACANISGATGMTYVLVAADVGKTIRCQVTAVNASGSSTAASSAATAVVAGLPAPPPPSAMTLIFPRNAGAAGTDLPERGSGDPNPPSDASKALDWNRMDYEGWGDLDGVNERMTWVTDPKGSGRTVVRLEIQDNDDADQYLGQRSEFWLTPHDHANGGEAWFAFGYLFGDGTTGNNFIDPSSWQIICQNHGAAGNPPQAVEIGRHLGQSATKNIELKVQTQPSSGQTYYQLGPMVRGRWHYFVMYVKFSSTGSGIVRCWYALDAKPNVALSPTASAVNVNTLYTGTGFAKIGLYRGDAGSGDYPCVAYLWGYGRDASAAAAIANAGLPS